jgi:hypothetical protein
LQLQRGISVRSYLHLPTVIQIQNENGVTCWEGSLAEFAKLDFAELQEKCEDLPELEGHTFVHFDARALEVVGRREDAEQVMASTRRRSGSRR